MEKIDVVIVGAGLAGLSCAYALADSGLTIVVIERGDFPGSKNVTGGRIYLAAVRGVLPILWEEAPLERHVVREILTLMGEENSTSFTHYSERRNRPPYPSYTILRARFDRWFAEKVGEKGVFVIPQKHVDGLMLEGGRVVGVKAGEEEIPAEVVVAADGVLSFLAEKAKLRESFKPEHYAVGVKEIIYLGRERIEDRFNLGPGEGAAQLFVGSITRGMMGGGFLYTNEETLSIGMVVGIGALNQKEPRPEVYQILDAFKARPEIQRIIQGGDLVEYSAHLIPEGGIHTRPKSYTDGMLLAGDAAGFGLNMMITVRGMEYAMISGVLAAQAIKRAKERNDFSASSLAYYEELLKGSIILKDLRTFSKSLQVLRNPRLFSFYPGSICDLFEELMWIDENPKGRLFPTASKRLRKDFLTLQGIRDIWSLRGI